MTVYEVECSGRSRWDDHDSSHSLYFKSKELAAAYVAHMEDKYSDYIDEVMECENLMKAMLPCNLTHADMERRCDLEDLLKHEFGYIIPRYYISPVYIYDCVPMD